MSGTPENMESFLRRVITEVLVRYSTGDISTDSVIGELAAAICELDARLTLVAREALKK